jgi:hypothetical protein
MKVIFILLALFITRSYCIFNGTISLGTVTYGITPSGTGNYDTYYVPISMMDQLQISLTGDSSGNGQVYVRFFNGSIAGQSQGPSSPSLSTICSASFNQQTQGYQILQVYSVGFIQANYTISFSVLNSEIDTNGTYNGSFGFQQNYDLQYATVIVPENVSVLRIFITFDSFSPFGVVASIYALKSFCPNLGRYSWTSGFLTPNRTNYQYVMEINGNSTPVISSGTYYIGVSNAVFSTFTYRLKVCFGQGCQISFVNSQVSSLDSSAQTGVGTPIPVTGDPQNLLKSSASRRILSVRTFFIWIFISKMIFVLFG